MSSGHVVAGDDASAGPFFVADRALVTRRIGDETILVPVSSRVGDLDSIYTLSEVGSRIWSLLASPVTLAQISAMLCTEYEVSPEVANADAVAFIDALVVKKLAHAVDGPKA
jgi:hypothetical protein